MRRRMAALQLLGIERLFRVVFEQLRRFTGSTGLLSPCPAPPQTHTSPRPTEDFRLNRSKKPELVEQELYAVLIVYNLVRELIHQAVAEQHQKIRRISFLDSLQCIIDAIPQMNIAGPTQAESQLQYLRSLIAECVIDRPHRHRINPRVVKVKMSKFKRKRKIHKSSHRDLESELQILRLEAA